MDALAFKTALEQATPNLDALFKIGLSQKEAMDIIAGFEMRERLGQVNSRLPDTVLRDLFAQYDASNVELGMVRLCEVPEEVACGWMIGKVETDYLFLDTLSGEIEVKDRADVANAIWKCAQDGACLLAALANAAKYLSACILEDQSGSHFQQQTLRRCTTLAGGAPYVDFYRMLLGLA
ncbi:hypothetical protein [Rhizobium herbae]|uniref:Uncharacterized protein n=1 Tax=Rhizobium herbae TaxID=508661 RepID=A0ABS4EGS2_9HYPH|nr:hypothetical protein [Rhizobium herbae]MBP1857141.1 hypothetical protein [Rhizobium herbae]